jgi:hypothetical protein
MLGKGTPLSKQPLVQLTHVQVQMARDARTIIDYLSLGRLSVEILESEESESSLFTTRSAVSKLSVQAR